MPIKPASKLDEQIMQLASRPQGMSLMEINTDEPGKLSRTIPRLIKDELIHKAVRGHRTIRYFTNPLAAQAYRQNQNTVITTPSFSIKGSKTWGPEDPAIMSPNVKITIAPPMPDRPLKTNTHWQF